ncbi:MAG: 4Fe-4S single cluster domain-containing protein [Actinomycetota bacterium]|nr:4Fe-4S single cluster domain-containing protein [Actinomycetota bacterium]
MTGVPRNKTLAPLNLAGFLPRSRVNGPGQRAVLWVQGCDLRCPGCCNPAFLKIRHRRSVAAEVAAEAIVRLGDVEGVTYSGGEPTLQASGLARLSRILRSEGLSVMCYTGHTYEELLASGNAAVAALLDSIDLLVDGPYVRALAPGGIWRGSANQRLVPLTPRYADLCADIAGSALDHDTSVAVGVEVHLRADSLTWTGIFPPELVRRVEAYLLGAEHSTVREVVADPGDAASKGAQG